MVVKMMKWRLRPPLVSKKYKVKLIVKTLTVQGCDLVRSTPHDRGFAFEIKWKGPKLTLSSLRRNAVARNFTKESHLDPNDDVVLWNEEFHIFCTLSSYKDNTFLPWEITFSLFNSSRRNILPWRKRKLSFISPKSKGEPLLKKAYGEDGGDDIDYDR